MQTEQTTTNAPAIWGHSTPVGSRSYVIFCVGQEPRMVAAFRVWATAQGIAFKSLKGCYQGQTEDSFIVGIEDFPKVRPWTAGQESVLLLGPCDARDRRSATLLFRDGGRQQLGKFHACSKAAALSRSAWTYDPSQNLYFITEESQQDKVW